MIDNMISDENPVILQGITWGISYILLQQEFLFL